VAKLLKETPVSIVQNGGQNFTPNGNQNKATVTLATGMDKIPYFCLELASKVGI